MCTPFLNFKWPYQWVYLLQDVRMRVPKTPRVHEYLESKSTCESEWSLLNKTISNLSTFCILESGYSRLSEWEYLTLTPKSWRVHESLTLGAKEYLRVIIAPAKLDNFHLVHLLYHLFWLIQCVRMRVPSTSKSPQELESQWVQEHPRVGESMSSRAPKSWRVHESLTLGAKEYLRVKTPPS